MTLRAEMWPLVRTLEAGGIPYALCGGLAMAVHGWPRATMAIDLLIEEGRLADAKRIASAAEFAHDAGDMAFSAGRVRLHRLVKLASPEFIPLDLRIVMPELQPIWRERITMQTEDGDIAVVSAPGLIQMKSLRNSGTDQDDIRKLKGEFDEDG